MKCVIMTSFTILYYFIISLVIMLTYTKHTEKLNLKNGIKKGIKIKSTYREANCG